MRNNTFEAGTWEGKPGGVESREIFQATRKLPSIPLPAPMIFRRFLELLPLFDTSDKLHVHTIVTVTGWHEISSMEINFRFDRCNRALVCAPCVNVACRALPIARSDSCRDAVNMLIYWRKIRLNTQVHVWFHREIRWMPGISVNCYCQAEYWFLPKKLKKK